jgi:hypothetical protein
MPSARESLASTCRAWRRATPTVGEHTHVQRYGTPRSAILLRRWPPARRTPSSRWPASSGGSGHPHGVRLELFKSGQAVPSESASFELDTQGPFAAAIETTYLRLLVDQHGPAIARVAKHLERHSCIPDQAMLDDLIARAERLATPANAS